MFDKLQSRLELSGWLAAKTAFVGAGRSTAVVGTDLPVVRDAEGKPYIPGSSFKGVLRSRLESLVRAILPHRKGACNPIEEAGWCVQRGELKKENWVYPAHGVNSAEKIGFRDLEKGLPDARHDVELSQRLVRESCLLCQTFGSPWLASKVLVRDLLMDTSIWFEQFQVRDGVAIDRDTETASEGKLYDYEVVPSGTRFHFKLLLENGEPWQWGMVFIGLKAMENGSIPIGGSKSRGLGWVKLDLDERKLFSLDGEEGNARIEKLIGFVDGSAFISVSDKMIKDWITAFKGQLAEMERA